MYAILTSADSFVCPKGKYDAGVRKHPFVWDHYFEAAKFLNSAQRTCRGVIREENGRKYIKEPATIRISREVLTGIIVKLRVMEVE